MIFSLSIGPRWFILILIRLLLALTPLSIIHPDEFLQSVQPMSHLLIPEFANDPRVTRTWDWSFTCVDDKRKLFAHEWNATRAADLPHLSEWMFQQDMNSSSSTSFSYGSIFHLQAVPNWKTCPEEGMAIQPPIRGTFAPWFSSGVPFQLYHFFQPWTNSTTPSIHLPHALFYFPRTQQFCLSLLTDFFLFLVARRWYNSETAGKVMQTHSYSFVALVLLSRTFSNCLETTILAAMLTLARPINTGVARGDSSSSSLSYVLFGILIGLGASVRLSILFFAWPIGVFFIYQHYQLHLSTTSTSHHWLSRLRSLLQSTVSVSLIVAIPTLIVIFLLAVCDSFFYETLWICNSYECASGLRNSLRLLTHCWLNGTVPIFKGSLLFTPLTNYLYNSVPANVAHHGLHPHYLHLTLNMLILFGPAVYLRFIQASYRTIQQTLRSTPTAAPSSPSHKSASTASQANPFDLLLVLMAWSGILLLSLIPHQEFRFLLPASIPLTLLINSFSRLGSSTSDSSNAMTTPSLKFVRFLHHLHTVVTVVVLGCLHQGGLIRSWTIPPPRKQFNNNWIVVSTLYFNTYTTPTAFIYAHEFTSNASNHMRVSSVDDIHRPDQQLLPILQQVMAEQRSLFPSDQIYEFIPFHRVRLILPGSVPLPISTMLHALEQLYPNRDGVGAPFPPYGPIREYRLMDHCRHHICLRDDVCQPHTPPTALHLTLDDLTWHSSTHPPSDEHDDAASAGPIIFIDSTHWRAFVNCTERNEGQLHPWATLLHPFQLWRYDWYLPNQANPPIVNVTLADLRKALIADSSLHEEAYEDEAIEAGDDSNEEKFDEDE